MTAAEAKSYTGFEAQPIEQKTIANNDITIVEIKYDRITLKIGRKINSYLKTIGENAAPGTDWSKSETITASNSMFEDCIKLTGGAGTTVTDYGITYARIDGGPNAPGYFTEK